MKAIRKRWTCAALDGNRVVAKTHATGADLRAWVDAAIRRGLLVRRYRMPRKMPSVYAHATDCALSINARHACCCGNLSSEARPSKGENNE